MSDQKTFTFACCMLLIILCGEIFSQQVDRTKSQNQNDVSRQPGVQRMDAGLNPPRSTNQTSNPTAPNWVKTITPEHHQFINQLLDYWQQSSQKVNQYQCEFARYDYDTKFCNYRDPQTNRLAAASIMTGEIRFASPDKASYETLQVFDFPGPPQKPGEPLEDYKPRVQTQSREKWICDGKAIFEFDFENKKLYETEIPAEMQGKGLVNSPIPFLFGASKDDILNRFWVRVITPDNVQNEYWMEAVPRKIDDARNYKKVEIVISRNEFLPIMLHLYAPDYDPAQNNFTSRVFEFKNRKVNANLAKMQNFFNRFVRPSTPGGWERVPRNALQTSNPQIDRRLLEGAQRPNNRQIK